MTTMLAALIALSTPLVAQTEDTVETVRPVKSAIGVGFAATLGSEWQIEGGEVAYVRRFQRGGLSAISLGARIGAFIDEGAILGGTRGFVFAPTFGARTGTLSIAEIGEEVSATTIGLDVTFELSGYIASSSPLSHGSRWAGIALLPGIRVGSGNGPRYAFVIGPTLFFGGGKSTVRGLLAFRGEAPLARGDPHP